MRLETNSVITVRFPGNATLLSGHFGLMQLIRIASIPLMMAARMNFLVPHDHNHDMVTRRRTRTS